MKHAVEKLMKQDIKLWIFPEGFEMLGRIGYYCVINFGFFRNSKRCFLRCD